MCSMYVNSNYVNSANLCKYKQFIIIVKDHVFLMYLYVKVQKFLTQSKTICLRNILSGNFIKTFIIVDCVIF